jgi:hypothetical protein
MSAPARMCVNAQIRVRAPMLVVSTRRRMNELVSPGSPRGQPSVRRRGRVSHVLSAPALQRWRDPALWRVRAAVPVCRRRRMTAGRCPRTRIRLAARFRDREGCDHRRSRTFSSRCERRAVTRSSDHSTRDDHGGVRLGNRLEEVLAQLNLWKERSAFSIATGSHA